MSKPVVSTRLLLAASVVAALALPPLLLRAEPENWDAIRAEVERLPQADRDRLNRNTADFQRMSEAERQRYRDLHAIIESDEQANRGDLKQTLDDYTAWLATTHAYDRQLLLQAGDPKRRVAEVERIVEERNQSLDWSRSRRSRFWMWRGNVPDLTADELDRVMSVVENGLSFNPDERQKLRDKEGNEKAGVARYFALFGILKDRGENLGPVFDRDLDRLFEAVPESKRPADLDGMSVDGRKGLCVAMIIGNVLQEFESQFHQTAPTDADLRQVVKDWPQDPDSLRKLDELMELEPADFRRELENQFAKKALALNVDDLPQILPPMLFPGGRGFPFWGRGRREDRPGDGPDDRGRRPGFRGDGDRPFRDRPGFFRGRPNGPPDGRGPDDGSQGDGPPGPPPNDDRPPPDGERRPPPP